MGETLKPGGDKFILTETKLKVRAQPLVEIRTSKSKNLTTESTTVVREYQTAEDLTLDDVLSIEINPPK